MKIEGFDPAKFKAANKAGAGDSRAEVLVTAHISQHSFRWVDVVTVLGTVLMSPGRPWLSVQLAAACSHARRGRQVVACSVRCARQSRAERLQSES